MAKPRFTRGESRIGRLAISIAGDDPPSEFRIFAAGWNDTEKGSFLFDEEAAASVMAAFEKWAIDVPIDLEHQMLEGDASADPTARDARGWCRLEVRDGELWAVNVTWTPDGEARLREKRQRYISPAFSFDENDRVTQIVNVAITALPATHGAQELVAASGRAKPRNLRTLSSGPSFSDVCKAVDKALSDFLPGAYPWIVEIYDASVIYSLGSKLFEAAYALNATSTEATITGPATEVRCTYTPIAPEAPAQAAPTQSTTRRARLRGGKMDPELLKKATDAIEAGDGAAALEILKSLLVSAATGEAPATPPDPAAASATDEQVAAASALLALTGRESLAEAVAEIRRRNDVAVASETRSRELAAAEATLSTRERRALVVQLITLGAETPATAWADDSASAPCKRLESEPLEELRARVAKLAATGKPRAQPPAGTGDVGLTDRELAMCRAKNIDPKAYAETRARIRGNSAA